MYRDRHFNRTGKWHKTRDAFVPPTPPVISNVVVDQITNTGARISWSVAPNANGRVDYGTDVGYGSSTTQEAGFLPNHIQTISGLTLGTLYYFRIVSAKADGGQAIYESTFTTTGAVLTTPNIYGSGMVGDDKGNLEIGTTWGGIIAHRFRASSSSAPSYLIWPCRTGPGGYSNGTGGTIRIGVRADDGSSSHYPVSGWLTYTDVVPGNPGATERFLRTNFSGAPSLTAGQLYHVVFQNIDGAPNSNWVSVNCMYKPNPYTPRHPAFFDADFGIAWRGPAWTPNNSHTPHYDLTLADGTHEGNAYGTGAFDVDQQIVGTSSMVRERFTVSGGSKVVTGVYVRVSRLSGTGNLTIRLEDDSGNLIDQKTDVVGSGIPIGTYRTINSTGGEWVGYTFSTPRTLTNGQTYRLRVSGTSGSTYYARPIRWKTFHHTGTDWMRSRYFPDGTNATYGGAEFTTNGGGSWTGFYAWLPQDLQFYFNLQ